MDPKPVTLGDQIVRDGAKQLEGILGVTLPDGATVTAPDGGGIRAAYTDTWGTRLVVEIDSKGEVFRSSHCGERVEFCRNHDRVKQSGSVSPDKLAKARALLLGAKIIQQGNTEIKR